MKRRLPPLNAIRAFEAAARHLSFIKAAEELGVTPGAVSQQVRVLEQWLGRSLFRRLAKGVRLTDAGQELWPALRHGLDLLAGAVARVRREARGGLTVSTLPSFAARWLIPRLGSFHALHPQMEVKVLASVNLTDFAVDEVDLAIRYGGGDYPGLFSELLMEEEVFPVCSPRLLENGPALHTPSDLRRFTLLHDLPDPNSVHELNWAKWLEAIGVEGIDTERGPKFTYTHMSLSAAVAGQGVALATSALIGDDLDAGRLIRLLRESVPAPHRYWLVCPSGQESRPHIAAFRSWAKREAGRS